MVHKVSLGLCLAAVALAIACGQTPNAPVSPSSSAAGAGAAADGSTLKVAAPIILSPTNNFQFAPNAPTVLSFQTVKGTYASFPATYEVEVKNASGNVAANPKNIAGTGSTAQTTVTGLAADTSYTWRVRATYASGPNAGFGPWSSTASFKSAPAAFLGTNSLFDPLTGGFTVGKVVGPGHFIPGQGWQADSYSSGIDYDLGATCSSCQLDFDVTGVGNGLGNPADLKWVSMADAGDFGDFNSFRDGPWKMTVEERGDGDGTGMKMIWRNGCGNCGDGEPGDHTGKLASTVNWKDTNVYHFTLRWTPSGFSIQVDGTEWFADGFGGNRYAPPHHRISLGCYPRGETLLGAIWRNVQLKPI